MPDRPLTAPELASMFEATDNAELARQERAMKAENTDRLAEIQARDSRTLAAAPASSDDWDDNTWAAWSRCADRAHTGGGEHDLKRLQAENAELRTQLALAEKHARELDRALGETIDDRDRTEEAADKLAYAVAPIEVIGEHSSMNCPWQNALDLITPMAEVDRLRAELKQAKAGGSDGR